MVPELDLGFQSAKRFYVPIGWKTKETLGVLASSLHLVSKIIKFVCSSSSGMRK